MKNTANMNYRHGDVFLRSIEKLPDESEESKKENALVLAYGEATGHAHRLVETVPQTIKVYEHDGKTYLQIMESAELTHEEHRTLTIAPATYEVVHEREYCWFTNATRRMMD